MSNAEETARGRGDSASQAEQAKEVNSDRLDSEETVVEAVGSEYWRKPHPRIVYGPLTGDRP